MTTAPTFPRFAAAPKCDPALLLRPRELLLDRPVRRRWTVPTHFWELAALGVLLVAVVWAGSVTWRLGELEKIEAAVAELVMIQARQAELARIVGSEESRALQKADRERAEVVRPIERAP